MKKRTAIFMAALLAVFMFSVPAAAALEAGTGDDFYVADTAGVLAADTRSKIASLNGDLEYYCEGAQFVVVTVDYIGDLDSEEYAFQLMNDWGVGGFNTGKSNGMLLLFSPIEKRGWLAVGDDIDNAFTNGMAEDYMNNYFWPDCDAGNYDEAVSSLTNALTGWYIGYYDVNTGTENTNTPPYQGDGYENEPDGNGFYEGFVAFSFVIIILVFIVAASLGADRRRYYDYYYYTGGPIPPYHFWYMWWGPRLHHHWHDPRGPRGPRGPGPGGFGGHGGGGFGGGGGGFGGGGFGGGGHSGGGFGGGGHAGGGGGRH